MPSICFGPEVARRTENSKVEPQFETRSFSWAVA
jgi:hypothetical protein